MDVLIITLKGDIRYHFGIEKKVKEVVKEIEECQSDYYHVIDTCAIRKSDIVSVEIQKYQAEREEDK